MLGRGLIAGLPGKGSQDILALEPQITALEMAAPGEGFSNCPLQPSGTQGCETCLFCLA